MYKAITGSDELVLPSSPIPRKRQVVSGVQRCGKGEHELLQLPFTIVERTYVSCLEPARDAVEVERVLQGACNMISNPLLQV